MKLIFVYVRSFKNIREQKFLLSDDYDVTFEKNRLRIGKTDMEDVKSFLYNGNLIKDMHIIVGRTGAGKTNLLQLIGMDYGERAFPENKGSYFLLYKCNNEENLFAVEVYNMFIPQISRTLGLHAKGISLNEGFWQFRYDEKKGELRDVRPVEERFRKGTAIVNTFDKNAFTRYPYHDVVQPHEDPWIPRKVTPYSESYPANVVNAAKEYVEQMPEDSIKRKAAFVINRENWQHRLNVELPRDLLEQEYWLYGRRRQDGIVTSLSDIPYARMDGSLPKGQKGAKSSEKEMFIHDLLTDYAIYLRKVADSVLSLSRQLSKYRPLHKLDGIDSVADPTVLPDGVGDLSVEKRLSWLGQYIDYHTDGQMGNKGLVWQECKEIREMAEILRQFEDGYFTPDQFICPLVDIREDDKRFRDLFESMGQYHRDQYGVFPKEYLPYTMTYLSSGEFQLAKIWGTLEEAVETKIASRPVGGGPTEMRNMHLTVLMDEPETYLHPEYCREFIYNTVKILAHRKPELQLQLIITTHSPFMLSDTISSQVTCVDYDEYGECVVCESSEKQFFAANIFSIMADGFFLDYTIGEYSRTFLSEKFELLKKLAERQPEITEEEKEHVRKIRAIVPYIGDEMIRLLFSRMLNHLGYA